MATTKKRAGAKKAAAKKEAPSEYGIQVEQILTDLDPHLQEVVLKQRTGQPQSEAFVTANAVGEQLVDVIAKLKDPSVDVPGLSVIRKIGDIVTATVDISVVESVRIHPNVLSLKRANQVGVLRFSVPEIGADKTALRNAVGTGNPAVNGSGVIIGIVDIGLDPTHQNFQNVDGTSRILFYWDQNGPKGSMTPAGFLDGREWTQTQINAALQSPNPLNTLSLSPPENAHGTHVTDIAAGNGFGSGIPGVAPEADIIFVELKANLDTGDDSSFGNSRLLLEAVDYIFEKATALGRPCVVNLSLGTHGGPHDGTTLAEQGFDNLLKTPNRAIVVAAGNSFEKRGHASSTLAPTLSRILTWRIPMSDPTGNELEVWYPGGTSLEVTLTDPTGKQVAKVMPGNTVTITRAGVPGGRIISRQADPNNGSNQIDIILTPAMPSGQWKVELRNPGAVAVPFDAWIERDDAVAGIQSFFLEVDADPAKTIGSISTGHKTIAVGSYDARVVNKDISSFSSSGPTRDGRQKPEVSAPGQDIRAAKSLTTRATVPKPGTSMAAPHVAGLVALVMQAAGRPLTCDEIRKIVMDTARANPPAAGPWDPRYGFGRIDASAAVRAVLPASVPEVAIPTEAAAVAAASERVRVAAAGANGSFDVRADGWSFINQLVEAAERTNSKVTLHLEVEPRS